VTAALCLVHSAPAQAPKRIYLANDDHTDYMWTADEATYRAAFLEMLDYYLALVDATTNQPPEFQSRWNCDGHFWLSTYEQNRTPAQFQHLIERIHSGHLSAPLNPLAVVFGGTPAEAVIRSAYYPGLLERRYNLRFPLAYAMENQTLPYGLGAVWAGCGAKYSWRGICGCASKVPDNSSARPCEIYNWLGPDGSKLLLKWNSLHNNESIGGYAEARAPANVVDYVDRNATFTARYPYRVIGAFGKGWDDLKTLTNEFITVATTQTTANRLVRVSNEIDFFEDFEQTYTNVPSFNACFGNEWELYVASLAEVSARVKRATEKLRAAEAMATLVSRQRPGVWTNYTAARNLAHLNLGLYFEHDWTGDGPVARSARAAWQRKIAGEIENYVDPLHVEAASALGGMIGRSSTNFEFYAFNPLGWTRSDAADLAWSDPSAVHVLDLAAGTETPSQFVTNGLQRFLRVLAQDVPAVGYKVFAVIPGPGGHFAPAASVTSSNIIENEFHRVTVAGNGAITSWKDPTRNHREFARDLGGKTLNDLGAGAGTVTLEEAGPVTVTLLATATGPLAHQTRVTLLRGSPRLAIRNEITQNFGNLQTWSFGFNLPTPDVWHEEVGAVIHARLLSEGGHYATNHARYDWLTLNHFADLSSDDVGVTLANADCYYFRLGNSTVTSLDTNTAQISVLAGGQVDGAGLGMLDQGGDTNFIQRFALQTHNAYDPAAAMRFALEFQNPLVCGPVTGGPGYPARSFSFLTNHNSNVLLWALKPAEEGIGDGIIARVWNLSTAATNFSLALAQPMNRARRVTHIETDLGPAALTNSILSAPINPQQLLTFRLQLAPEPRALRGQ
jgi:alpha-mannosidase